MPIKYVTGRYMGKPIEKIDIERETDKCIWVRGNRRNKQSGHKRYWDSWDEAKAYLLADAARRLINATARLDVARENLEKIKKLEKSYADD